MTTRRVIVHIGAPKTGTTFLQGALWANKAELEDQGVFVPGRRQRAHFSAGNDLLGDAGTRFTKQQRVPGAWARLKRQVEASSLPLAVFTDERLAALPPEAIEEVAELGRSRELHVVYTVRDMHSLLPSAWQEQVKHGGAAPLEGWTGRILSNRSSGTRDQWFWRVHDVVEVLQRWEAAVAAPSRIHVVTLPRSGSGPDELWRRFAAATGLPADVPLSGVDTSNVSLDRAQVEFLRRVNLQLTPKLEPDEYRTWIRDLLAKRALSARSAGARAGVPPKHHEAVAELSDEVITQLAATDYDIVGSLEDLRPRVEAAPAPAPTAEDLLAAGVDGMAGLIEEVVHDLRSGRGLAAHRDETRARPVAELGVDLASRSRLARWALARYRAVRRRLSTGTRQ